MSSDANAISQDSDERAYEHLFLCACVYTLCGIMLSNEHIVRNKAVGLSVIFLLITPRPDQIS